MSKFTTSDIEQRLEAAVALARTEMTAQLPPFPDDGKCPHCGHDGSDHGVWQIRELGYERWTNCDVDRDDDDEPSEAVLHAHTDGWDDYSEHGSIEWVECNPHNGGCGAAFQVPESVEYD